MNEEFRNNSGAYCAFTDDGIVCKDNFINNFYPYGSIDKIGIGLLGVLDIAGKRNGKTLTFFYSTSDKQQKVRIKELIAFAKLKMKDAPKTDVVEITPKKSVEEVEAERRKQEEIRIKCNTCGHVFCYSKSDIERNRLLAKDAKISNVLSGLNALAGNAYHMYEQDKQAQKALDKIVDYSKCPHCGSSDLRDIGEDELKAEQAKSNNNGGTAISCADELKKYKDLLDMGVITQEEFDAKKKQLLGL